ncbi:hypothetical protein KI387_013263, partial [Taxus chinensis]
YLKMERRLLLVLFCISLSVTGEAIGVNYGTLGDNLPPPTQVAKFLQSTSIDKVKLFGADPAILQALANTNIGVVIAVANADIPGLAKLPAAQAWVEQNVVPFVGATKIIAIAVGNEVLSTGDKNLIAHLLPAMQNLHTALAGTSLEKQIKVSTPHSLGILAASEPPSIGRFRRGYDRVIIKPLLSFLRSTGAPFMINPYPYFGYTSKTLNYALFKPNPGVHDTNTGITYTNMFVAQLDAVYSAMKLLGFSDVDIVVAETGWPSLGDLDQPAVNMENAVSYNGNLIKFVTSNVGTPLMPNRTFDTYIFALFNENLKPGSTAERNFGLFKPDMTMVYDVGLLKTQSASPAPSTSTAKYWCVAKPDVDQKTLQANIDYACGKGVNCSPIQPGGACFDPNTIAAHATYAMNAYYQSSTRTNDDCSFRNTALLTPQDPSYGECVYQAV